jgi:catechol 2,3-dioxygenase-like lactoylglutathione lyase family enzyme
MLNVQIQSLDHVVFNVADTEASLRFYVEMLGLEPVRVDDYRAGRVPFPSVRISSHTILDLFPPEYHQTTPGGNNVNHIALNVGNTPRQLEAFLKAKNVEIVREMTGNFGARGDGAHAFHVVDPDGNVLELQTYET